MNGVGFQHGAHSPESLGEKSDIVANLRSRRIRAGLKQGAKTQETRPKPGSGSLHARALETIGQLRTEAVGFVFVVGGVGRADIRLLYSHSDICKVNASVVIPYLINMGATLGQVRVSKVQRQVFSRCPAKAKRENPAIIRGNPRATCRIIGWCKIQCNTGS